MSVVAVIIEFFICQLYRVKINFCTCYVTSFYTLECSKQLKFAEKVMQSDLLLKNFWNGLPLNCFELNVNDNFTCQKMLFNFNVFKSVILNKTFNFKQFRILMNQSIEYVIVINP